MKSVAIVFALLMFNSKEILMIGEQQTNLCTQITLVHV